MTPIGFLGHSKNEPILLAITLYEWFDRWCLHSNNLSVWHALSLAKQNIIRNLIKRDII